LIAYWKAEIQQLRKCKEATELEYSIAKDLLENIILAILSKKNWLSFEAINNTIKSKFGIALNSWTVNSALSILEIKDMIHSEYVRANGKYLYTLTKKGKRTQYIYKERNN
jgi:predicted transcriptional regulator